MPLANIERAHEANEGERAAARAPVVIELAGIEKSFASGPVLKGVSIACRAGEVRALLGENGAGKSTLVKIIAGAIRADAGTMKVGGAPVRFATPVEAAAGGIGVVYQELTLVDSLDIGENLGLGREPRKIGLLDRKALDAVVADSLATVRLARGTRDRIRRLSVAEMHLLEVARWVSRRFKVLIFDEPTSALGPAESAALFALIDTLKRQGMAILYISHRLDEVTAICDAVTVLKDGRVVLDAPVAGLDEGEIIAHMIGREIAESDVREPGAPAEGAPVLSIEHLSGDHFDDVSHAVRPGEIVGLTGLVGCGALEIMETVAGVRPVRSGTMTLAGAPLPAGDPVAAVRRGIRFAPEDRKRDGLALTRPVRENIAMGIADGSTGQGVIRLRDEAARVAEAAARVSLAPTFLDRECRHLSGGQQQKVMLARCLVGGPRLLLLDEPTRGVDVGARAEIHGIIRRLARAGLAILVVSSDTKETAALCDRVLVMDRGRVSAALEGDAITREAMIAAASRTRTAADRPAAGVAPARKPPLWTRLGDAGVPVAALLVTLVVFSLFAPHFLTFQNFDGLARQIVPLALASLGAMLVILVGGIDLSIGALVSIANMLSTSLLLSHGPEVAIAATLLLGFGVGTVNAIFARLGFPAFLATYAMALVLTGVSLAQFGQSVGPVPESFWVIATAQLGPIPVATLVALLLFVLAYVVLFKSVVGRHLFAFGADAESARLNGVRPFRMLWIAYASSGLLAAATGVFLSARIGAGLPQSGLGLELEAIAAVVLGGASLFGGHVSVVGTLAGVLVLSVIANGFNLMHIDPFYSGMLRGVIMLLVVGLWAARRRSAGSA